MLFYDRKFELASEDTRAYVDLRDYERIIRETVERVIPGATVVIRRNCFIIDALTQGQSRSLGRELSKTDLVKYQKTVCRLFAGSETTEKERKNLYEKRERKNVHKRR